MSRLLRRAIALLPLGDLPWRLQAFLVYVVAGLRPVAGASPEGDGDDEGDGDGGGDGDDGDDGGSSGDGDGDGEEKITVSRTDYDKLQKAVATSNKELRKLKADQERRDAEAKEKAGEHEKLYQEEKARRERLERELEQDRKERTVTAVATRLRFRNPTVAHRLIDLDDVDDEASAERALKALLREEPYLRDESRTQRADAGSDEGGDGGRGGGGSGGDDDEVFGVARLRRAQRKAPST